jgi:hypothetical protein
MAMQAGLVRLLESVEGNEGWFDVISIQDSEKGCAERIAPMCTLSQNGYGTRVRCICPWFRIAVPRSVQRKTCMIFGATLRCTGFVSISCAYVPS